MSKMKISISEHKALQYARSQLAPSEIMTLHIGIQEGTEQPWAGERWRELNNFSVEQMATLLYSIQGFDVDVPEFSIVIDKKKQNLLKGAYKEPYRTRPLDNKDVNSDWRQGFEVAMEILNIKYYGRE